MERSFNSNFFYVLKERNFAHYGDIGGDFFYIVTVVYFGIQGKANVKHGKGQEHPCQEGQRIDHGLLGRHRNVIG